MQKISLDSSVSGFRDMPWSDFPHELSRFSDALSSQEETETTANDLRRDQGKFQASWARQMRVATGDLPIRIPPPRDQALHPRLCQAGEAWVKFEFDLHPLVSGCPSIADMQVRVTGFLDIPNGLVEVEDHWRVDTDRYAESAPREPHPLFHFQRGGHAQDHFSADPLFVPGQALPISSGGLWRGLMQSPSPRLAIPPMCPILMIDFAIAQHNGLIWQRLRSQSEYARVVAFAQERLWVPFFDSLSRREMRRKWFGSLVVE